MFYFNPRNSLFLWFVVISVSIIINPISFINTYWGAIIIMMPGIILIMTLNSQVEVSLSILVYIFLLRRFFVLFDNYIFTYILSVIAIIEVFKTLLKSNSSLSFSKAQQVFIMLFLSLFVKDLILNSFVKPAQGVIWIFLKTWSTRFVMLIVAYIIAEKIPYLKSNYVKEKCIAISISLANITYLGFFLIHGNLFQRAINLMQYYSLETTSYLRIDPNFYTVESLFMILLFLNSEKLIVANLIILLMLNSLYFFSVTGFILIFLTIFKLIMHRKRLFSAILVLILLYLGIPLLSFMVFYVKYLPILSSLSSKEILNILLTGRVEKWQAYIKLIFSKPFGVGSLFTHEIVKSYLGYKATAHNLFLQILAQYGIFIGSIFIGILFKFALRYIKYDKESKFLLFTFLIASLVLALNDSFTFFLILGLISSRKNYSKVTISQLSRSCEIT